MRSRRSIRRIAAIAVLCAAAGWNGTFLNAQTPAGGAGEPARSNSARQPAAPRATAPELRLGKLDRPPARTAAIPVYFTAGHAKSTGSVRAELSIPGGTWIFQSAEAPAGAWWKISSKERGPEEVKEAGKEEGTKTMKSRTATVVELNFTAAGRALQDGLIGYLRFQVSPPGSPLPAGLAIRKVETGNSSDRKSVV